LILQDFSSICIVIPYYNALTYLNNAVNSIIETTNNSINILIVDNNSDKPFSVKGRKIEVIRNVNNLGFTKAINQGIKLYRNCDIIPFNSDSIALPNWIENLYIAAYSRNKVALVCPRHIIGNGVKKNTAINNLTSPQPFYDKNGYRLMRWAGFTCVYIKRSALEDVGLLDEKYWHFSSDEEWCNRARMKNWSIIYCNTASVKHIGGVSYNILKKRSPKIVQNKIDKGLRL